MTNKFAVAGFILSIPAFICAIPFLPIFLASFEYDEIGFNLVEYNALFAGLLIGLALGFSVPGFIRGIKRKCHKKLGLAGVIISGIAFVYTVLTIFFIFLCFGGAFKGMF